MGTRRASLTVVHQLVVRHGLRQLCDAGPSHIEDGKAPEVVRPRQGRQGYLPCNHLRSCVPCTCHIIYFSALSTHKQRCIVFIAWGAYQLRGGCQMWRIGRVPPPHQHLEADTSMTGMFLSESWKCSQAQRPCDESLACLLMANGPHQKCEERVLHHSARADAGGCKAFGPAHFKPPV